MAKAKAAMDGLEATANRPANELSDEETRRVLEAHWEWIEAANAVSAELIANGYHDLDGGEG